MCLKIIIIDEQFFSTSFVHCYFPEVGDEMLKTKKFMMIGGWHNNNMSILKCFNFPHARTMSPKGAKA